MENFDFSTGEQIKVLSIVPVRPHSFIYASIILSFLLSGFICIHFLFFFHAKRFFSKYMILILEAMNLMVIVLFAWIYSHLVRFAKEESLKLLFFFFYYNLMYLSLFLWYFGKLFYEVKTFYIPSKLMKDSADLTVNTSNSVSLGSLAMIFVPPLIAYLVQLHQHYRYYFTIKQIE